MFRRYTERMFQVILNINRLKDNKVGTMLNYATLKIIFV
jgi:hypothetical protein